MISSRSHRGLWVAAASAVAAGSTLAAYATVVERHHFVLRRATLPILPPDARPMTVLHVSDLHMTKGQRRKREWVRRLDDLEPDLVVNSGDTLTHADSLDAALEALEPLLSRPGVFVMGNNDYYAPTPKSPRRYLHPDAPPKHGPELPWRELGERMSAGGWEWLENSVTKVQVAEATVHVAGLDDPHLGRDRYEDVAGAPDPGSVLRLGLLHAPQPMLLDAFRAEGYRLALAGHTHGGQVRLPVAGALVTNCHIDRAHARGTFHWPPGGSGPARRHDGLVVNVSAGLGTSPYAPVRFMCRPEASLLTLVPETGGNAAGSRYTELA